MNTTRCHTLTKLLLSCLLLLMLTVTVSAVDTVASGTCGAEGDNLTWSLDSDGVLTISGSGVMPDYERGKTPWNDLCGGIKNVIVDEGVTRVGNNAFYDCKEITAVSLPDSLQSLGNAAFGWCYNLKSIVLPQGLQSIGISAFYWNRAIPEITIPASVQEIGAGAFARCIAMEAIHVEKDNAVYCDIDGVLFDKAGTTLVQYPAGRAGAYRIPDGVTGSAQREEFACAGKLTELTLPASMQKIGDFSFCGQLKSILVENGNPSYKSVDGVLFSADEKTLVAYPPAKRDADYTIPSGVEQIEDCAFHSAQVTQITVPDSVTKIGRMAFGYSDGLKQVIFEGSAPKMGESVFEGKRSVRVYYAAGASGWESYVRSDLLAFADKADIQHYDAAACLRSLGVEEALTESFEPQMSMTRKQVCKYIARLCGMENYKGSVSFSDVPVDNAFYPYIAFCVEKGYMRGTGDEIFSPDGDVTIYQFAKTLLLVLGYDEQAEGLSGPDWEIKTIKLADQLGLLHGVSMSSGVLSKDDMCQMLYSALFAKTVGYYSNGDRYEGDILLNKNDYDVRGMVWCGSKTPMLQKPLAVSSFDLVGSRNTGSRYGETPLCDLVADGLHWYANTVLGQNVDLAILNGGGIRTDLTAGELCEDDLEQMMPFGNKAAVMEIKGDQLLLAMEAACQMVPSGTTAFPQVSGMEYLIHSNLAFESAGDSLGNVSGVPYYRPAAVNRVEILCVGGKAFSPDAVYRIVTNDYLMYGGDAYFTFNDGSNRTVSETTLVEAIALYLSNGLNGVVPQKYSKTDGRVTVIRSCEAVLAAESQISDLQDIPNTTFQIENVCENPQEYILIASYYSGAQQQIAVEVKETGLLSQGNVQTLRLNGCEGAACAKLYVVHKDDLTPACAAMQYGGKTVSPVSAIEPLAQTHTARSIPSVDDIEAYSDHWWSTDADITADLSDLLGLTYSLTVSDRTSFASVPKTYDKDALIEWGKDPGLGEDILRKHGYTGSGAVIAYIDQPLQRPLHEEYESLKLHYINTVDGSGAENSMHGPAVLSLLAGKTIGTAPDAEIYYYAHASWKADQTTHANCLYQIIEKNKTLPDGKKIRMVGFSDNIDESEENADAFRAAVDACEAAGIMVWFCGEYGSTNFIPMSNKNDPDNLARAHWNSQSSNPELVFVPAGSRTTAATMGGANYTYWAEGGLSWTMPYMLGLYSVALSIDSTLTQEEIRTIVMDTATTNSAGMRIVNPVGFVASILDRVDRTEDANQLREGARSGKNYLYAMMDTAQLSEQDLTAIANYLSGTTEASVVIVDTASYSSAAQVYDAIKADHAARGGSVYGVQIFGTPDMVPAFSVEYKVQMPNAVDEGGSILTDLFYGNLDNDSKQIGSDYNVCDQFANGEDIVLTPAWPVVRLPLGRGEYAAYFENYNSFAMDAKLTKQTLVNFSNPIFASSDHIDDMGAFLNRMHDEFGTIDSDFILYGNQKGQYPVTTSVVGDFTAENLSAENRKGTREFLINSHGQRNNIDCCYYEEGEEKRETLINSDTINAVLAVNPYYLDCWTCSNAYGIADNLITTALKGRCVGAFAATGTISNNGVNCNATVEEMKKSNFYYFYYQYLKELNDGGSRSQAFWSAQRAYAAALIEDSRNGIRGEGNYQFNLYNLIAYQNFGVIEPNVAALALYDNAGYITQAGQSVPKTPPEQSGGSGYEPTPLTNGSPIGDEWEVTYGVGSRCEIADQYIIYSLRAQKLNNGYVRLSLDYQAPADMYVDAFNPPNGDLFMLFGEATTGKRQTFVCDILYSNLSAVSSVTMKFFGKEEAECQYVYIDAANILPGYTFAEKTTSVAIITDYGEEYLSC